MAFAQGTVTRTKFKIRDSHYMILDWTDLEAGAATEGTITGLPALFRLLKWKATAASSTVNTRFTNVTAAAAGSHNDLGTCATTAIQINEELNVLMELSAPGGAWFYKDQVASGAVTVQHRMIIKIGD